MKNRFGTTNEVGVFEMSSEGLLEVKKSVATLLFREERRYYGIRRISDHGREPSDSG